MKGMVIFTLFIFFSVHIFSQNIIIDKNEPGFFPIVSQKATVIYTDKNDDWLIQKTASLFQGDVESVTGQRPEILHNIPASAKNIIVIEITSENLIPKKAKRNIFYERNGYVSIDASHYTKPFNTSMIHWQIIPGIGRDGDGITTFPVTEKIQPETNSLPPHLEYEFYVYDTGMVKINAYFSPTLNFHNDSLGLQYAISIDDETPGLISFNKNDKDNKTWEKWVANNIIINSTDHKISKPGKHTIKYWMVRPGVILQKIIIDFGGEKPSYLGPPETLFKNNSTK